jgi:hypothetical protein
VAGAPERLEADTMREMERLRKQTFASPRLGPRAGSVTYRGSCVAHKLIFALPPDAAHTLPGVLHQLSAVSGAILDPVLDSARRLDTKQRQP